MFGFIHFIIVILKKKQCVIKTLNLMDFFGQDKQMMLMHKLNPLENDIVKVISKK